MLVQLPDDLFADEDLSPAAITARVTRALQVCRGVKASERALLLRQADLEWFDTRFALLMGIRTAEELRQRVDQLAGLSFGHLRFAFHPEHLAMLQRLAEGQGCTVEEICGRILKALMPQFLSGPMADASQAPFVVYVIPREGDPGPIATFSEGSVAGVR